MKSAPLPATLRFLSESDRATDGSAFRKPDESRTFPEVRFPSPDSEVLSLHYHFYDVPSRSYSHRTPCIQSQKHFSVRYDLLLQEIFSHFLQLIPHFHEKSCMEHLTFCTALPRKPHPALPLLLSTDGSHGRRSPQTQAFSSARKAQKAGIPNLLHPIHLSRCGHPARSSDTVQYTALLFFFFYPSYVNYTEILFNCKSLLFNFSDFPDTYSIPVAISSNISASSCHAFHIPTARTVISSSGSLPVQLRTC